MLTLLMSAVGGVALGSSLFDASNGADPLQTGVKGIVGLGLLVGGYQLAGAVDAEHVNRNFIDYVYHGIPTETPREASIRERLNRAAQR